jgi:hypothetical protein
MCLMLEFTISASELSAPLGGIPVSAYDYCTAIYSMEECVNQSNSFSLTSFLLLLAES